MYIINYKWPYATTFCLQAKSWQRLYSATGPNLHHTGCWIWGVLSTSGFTSWLISSNCSLLKFLGRDKQMDQERTIFWTGSHSCRNNIKGSFVLYHLQCCCSMEDRQPAKNTKPLKPHCILHFWWDDKTNSSYLCVREVGQSKIELKSRDTSKKLCLFCLWCQ